MAFRLAWKKHKASLLNLSVSFDGRHSDIEHGGGIQKESLQAGEISVIKTMLKRSATLSNSQVSGE